MRAPDSVLGELVECPFYAFPRAGDRASAQHQKEWKIGLNEETADSEIDGLFSNANREKVRMESRN